MEDVPEVVVGYQFAPQMTPERKQQKQAEREERERTIAQRSQPVHVWCSCQNCQATGNPIEHECCKSDDYASPWIVKAGINCITQHEGFLATALNDHVLQLVKIHLLYLVKNLEKRARLRSNDNATKRHLAYINFRAWVCEGKKLGKGNRVVTPACVLRQIRAKWPEESGIYTGFHAVENTIADL